jgi:arginine N-succinyltransferase
MIIRNARLSDIEALLNLSSIAPGGMTSMPYDRSSWERKLQLAEESLQSDFRRDIESVYLLIMEDPETNTIVGTAGIHAGVGLTQPFYNYKLSKHVKASEQLGIRVTSNALNLVNDFTGETELTSLFLKEDHRKGYAGQFLSRSRFMFIADFPERFSNVIFAEIRGWLDKEGNSPFWENLGKKFFNLPYEKADFISAVNGSQFISDLMPRFPVYLELLPEEVVSIIGKSNDDSIPAMKLLEKEGFQYKSAVDIFDAGPVVECERAMISSIEEAVFAEVGSIVPNAGGSGDAKHCMISNRCLSDYRLLISYIYLDDNNCVTMAASDAERLKVDVGSKVQLLALRT